MKIRQSTGPTEDDLPTPSSIFDYKLRQEKYKSKSKHSVLYKYIRISQFDSIMTFPQNAVSALPLPLFQSQLPIFNRRLMRPHWPRRGQNTFHPQRPQFSGAAVGVVVGGAIIAGAVDGIFTGALLGFFTGS